MSGFCRDQADGIDCDETADIELENAGVFFPVEVEVKVAAPSRAASRERPTPFGGWKPISKLTGPALPFWSGGRLRKALIPICSTTAWSGPRLALIFAARPMGNFPSWMPTINVRALIQ